MGDAGYESVLQNKELNPSALDLAVQLPGSYLLGWEYFAEYLGPITDPNIDWGASTSIGGFSPDTFPDTKVAKIYNLIKTEVFGGSEYTMQMTDKGLEIWPAFTLGG